MTPDLPVGGTTGICHESRATIDDAALWLIMQGDMTGRAVVPEIRQRFGLSALEACEVIRTAGQYRRGAR